MARTGEKDSDSCGWTEQAVTKLCRVWEGAHAIACVPLGTGTATFAGPNECAAAAL